MTQTQTKMQMADLYDRLETIGFPKKFIQQKILPDWWTDEVDETPGVLTEGALYISRRLNLDMQSLLDRELHPEFKTPYQPKFKLKVGTDTDRLTIPYVISARIAEMVAYACNNPYQPLDGVSVSEIRQDILARQNSVNLQGFLEYCWERGIPVIHFDDFPPKFHKFHKFHGMVGYFYDRPVILLSLKAKSPSRLLFIAAHELGHILKGHLNQEKLLVDEKISLESTDKEEVEANEVAGELLLGAADRNYYSSQDYTCKQLAQYAQNISAGDRVDAGVVARNYGWYKKHYGSVEGAMKILEPDANAPQEINRYLEQNLDWEKLGDDNQDYLTTMLNLRG
jgi:IrrE N-terminal-like domain